MDEWHFGRVLEDAARGIGLDGFAANRATGLIHLLIEQQNWFTSGGRLPVRQILSAWFGDDSIQRFLGVNRHKEVLWFNKEAYEELVWWMFLLAMFEAVSDPNAGASLLAERALLGTYPGEETAESRKSQRVSGQETARNLIFVVYLGVAPPNIRQKTRTRFQPRAVSAFGKLHPRAARCASFSPSPARLQRSTRGLLR